MVSFQKYMMFSFAAKVTNNAFWMTNEEVTSGWCVTDMTKYLKVLSCED